MDKEDLAKRGLRLSYVAKASLQKDNVPGQTALHGEQSKDPVTGAIKKLKRKVKAPGQVVDIPVGDPMFMFFGARGRTRSLNTFFDRGCSHAVLKDGIPGNELKGTLVQEGPFDIGGVGGARIQANSEWVVLLDREDGRKQIVQALTVDRVTTDFPMMNLTEAVNDVKKDDPNNSVLQQCSLPSAVGGSVDILMGIMYSSIFPVPVHCLESGLTIYKSKLSPHYKGFNAVIGGPHSSFSILAEKAGGTASLLAHFTEGLQAYRSWDGGAPRIKNYYIMDSVCCDDEEYSMMDIYQKEIDDDVTLVTDDEDNDVIENMDSEMSAAPANDDGNVDQAHQTSTVHCQHCAHAGPALTAADERISEMKRKLDFQGAGLEIEYRCVRCRECPQCKNADQTEKISLREEAEMVEIRNSVKLDWDNKRIQ